MTARSSVLTRRKLLGVLPDAEIARRTRVSPTTVGKTRAQLGIPVLIRGDLASTPPSEVLRRVRARAKAGKAMRTVGSSLPGDSHLADLCRYHFGGWYEAVVAAGLKSEGRRTPRPTPPPKKRPLTEELLRSGRSSGELERLTAVRKETIRRRRQRLGIFHDERPHAETWLAGVRRMLGKVPDSEIARQVGKHRETVSHARRQLGIPKPALRSRATEGDVRQRLAAMPKAELRRLLDKLEPIDASIVRRRYLRARPETLAVIGARFGVSRQRVAQREAVALKVVTVRAGPCDRPSEPPSLG